ncbi:DNA modification system-associated small protein [Maridesulfovibrio sp.]|uniref:DNA modification system-associated small protein n=1 Tax=Maridesulfovibrio sp. TaxID=2795000 RepID=UPI002AA7031A|nr:DNA modification system-associated small protein [Maridesulfovibrio sp.]
MDDSYLSDLPLWADDDTRAVFEQVCAENKIPVDVITELVVLQRERQHQERAAGIYPRFEEILGRID